MDTITVPDGDIDDGVLPETVTRAEDITNDRCILALRILNIHDKRIRRNMRVTEYLWGLSEGGLTNQLASSVNKSMHPHMVRKNYLMPLLAKGFIGLQEIKEPKPMRMYYITPAGKEYLIKNCIPTLLAIYSERQKIRV